jgi:hypothetical protein
VADRIVQAKLEIGLLRYPGPSNPSSSLYIQQSQGLQIHDGMQIILQNRQVFV